MDPESARMTLHLIISSERSQAMEEDGIRTSRADQFTELARFLRAHQRIKSFRISPTGD